MLPRLHANIRHVSPELRTAFTLPPALISRSTASSLPSSHASMSASSRSGLRTQDMAASFFASEVDGEEDAHGIGGGGSGCLLERALTAHSRSSAIAAAALDDAGADDTDAGAGETRVPFVQVYGVLQLAQCLHEYEHEHDLRDGGGQSAVEATPALPPHAAVWRACMVQGAPGQT